MTGMEYPFLGRFKNVEETHGHQSAKRGLPTSVVFRVSGENMVVEEVVAPHCTLDVHLGMHGRHQTAPLPADAKRVPIPNDGKQYFVATKVENHTSRNYCKLWLEGKRDENGERHQTPSRRPAGLTALVETQYGHYDDNVLRIYSGNGNGTALPQEVPVGESRLLQFGGDALTIILPRPKDNTNPSPTIQVLPQVSCNFSVRADSKAVVEVRLASESQHRVELLCGAARAQGVGQCSLEVDGTRPSTVYLTVYSLEGVVAVLSQTIHVPVLCRPDAAPVQVRVEENALSGARNIVATTPGSTIALPKQGQQFSGIPGVRIPYTAGGISTVNIHQPDGGTAQVSIQDSTEDLAWLNNLADGIRRHGQDKKALADALRTQHPAHGTTGEVVVGYLYKLLDDLCGQERSVPTLSIVDEGERLSNIRCTNNGTVVVKVGDDHPALLPSGRAVFLKPSQPVTFTVEQNGQQRASFQVEKGSSAEDAALRDLNEFLRNLMESLRPGRGQIPLVKSNLRRVPPPPASAGPAAAHLASNILDLLPDDDPNPTAKVVTLETDASSAPIAATFDGQGTSLQLSSVQTVIPSTVKSVRLLAAREESRGSRSIIPEVLRAYNSSGGPSADPSVLSQNIEQQTRPKEQDDYDLLNMLRDILGRLDGALRKLNNRDRDLPPPVQPSPAPAAATPITFAMADGRIHSVSCGPHRVSASVDGLPPLTLFATSVIPPTGDFASDGIPHTVTLTAVDRSGATVAQTIIQLAGSRGSASSTSDAVEIEISRGSGKTRVTARAQPAYRVSIEVEGQRTGNGTNICLADLAPDGAHRVVIVVTDSQNNLLQRIPLFVPRLSIPPFKVFVEQKEVSIESQDGTVHSISCDGGKEEMCRRHPIQPDFPHEFVLKQYATGGVSMQLIGEQLLRLPPLADAESVRDLVIILREAEGQPWSRTVARLMKLHGRTRSEHIKELIMLLVSKVLEQDAAERMGFHSDKVMDMMRSLKLQSGGGPAPSGHTLYFRLKGDQA